MGYMALRGAPVGREIEEQHEVVIDIYVVCYLKSRVRVMYAGPFEQRRIAHNRYFLVIHV